MIYLQIAAVPVPRDTNPVTAPAAALAARLTEGQTVEFRLHRQEGKTCCYLGFESGTFRQQAEAMLRCNGYLLQKSQPPKPAVTRHLLCRSVEQRSVVIPGSTPRQMLLPATITGESFHGDAIFQALSHMPDGCGISFFFRRAAALPVATVSHLSSLNPLPGTLPHTLLTGTMLFEAVGCVYGTGDSLDMLVSEALYAYSGLSVMPVSPATVDTALLGKVAVAPAAPAMQPLRTVYTMEELNILASLTSAGTQGFPLNKDTIFGIPFPIAPVPGKMFRLGFSANGTPMEIPLSRLRQHMFIGGPPGSGKGNQLFFFANQLHEENIPMLLIESAKEEMHHLRKIMPQLQVWTPREGEFLLNPFALEGDITLGEMRTALLQTLRIAFKLDGPLEELFSDALNRCFAKNGFTDNSHIASAGASPFGLSEFMEEYTRLLDEKGYSDRVKADMRTAGLVRLNSLFNQNRSVFDCVTGIPVEALLRGENLLQLNCLTTVEAKQMFMSILFIRICTYLRLRGRHCSDRPVKLAILLDESHNLLQPATDSQGRVFSFAKDFQNMLLELRSQGVAVILADQSSDNIPFEIVNTCATKVFFGASTSGGIATALPLAAADTTAMQHLYLLQPGEGCFITYGMPAPAFFACPNVIDLFHMEMPYPRSNGYWQKHPRLPIETFRECSMCPARGKCTLGVKGEARQAASVLNQYHGHHLSTLMHKDGNNEKAIIGRQITILREICQNYTDDRKYCALMQFVREFNRENPGALRAEALLQVAKTIWTTADNGPK